MSLGASYLYKNSPSIPPSHYISTADPTRVVCADSAFAGAGRHNSALDGSSLSVASIMGAVPSALRSEGERRFREWRSLVGIPLYQMENWTEPAKAGIFHSVMVVSMTAVPRSMAAVFHSMVFVVH